MQNYSLPIQLELYDNGEKLDSSSYSVQVDMLKSDETFIIQSTGITKNKNVVTFTADKFFTSIEGQAKMQILLKKTGEVTGTFVIVWDISPGAISEEYIESTSGITIKQELDASVTKAEDFINKNSNIVNNLPQINTNKGDIGKLKTDLGTTNNNVTSNRNAIADSNKVITSNKALFDKLKTDFGLEVTKTDNFIKSLVGVFGTTSDDMYFSLKIPTVTGVMVVEGGRQYVESGNTGVTITPKVCKKVRVALATPNTSGYAQIGVLNNRSNIVVKHSGSDGMNVMYLVIGDDRA